MSPKKTRALTIEDILDLDAPGAKALLADAQHIAALDGGFPDEPTEQRKFLSNENLMDEVQLLLQTRGIEHYAKLLTSQIDSQPFNRRKNYGVTKTLLNKLGYENLQNICFGAQYVKLHDEVKEHMTPTEILTFYESMGRLKVQNNPPNAMRTGKDRYEMIDDILAGDPVLAMSRLAQFGFAQNTKGYGALQRDQEFSTKKGDYKKRLSGLENKYICQLKNQLVKKPVELDDKNRPIGIYDPNVDNPNWNKTTRNNYMSYILRYM